MNPPSQPVPPPLPADPAADLPPVAGMLGAIEAVLRQPQRIAAHLRQSPPGGLIASLLAVAVACGAAYGVVVGTFSGRDQLWLAPVKITAGLLFSALICLPSLYIFSCLGGSRARLVEVGGLLAGLLALLTVLLVGFAPVALVFSTSTGNVAAMGALHLVFGLIATGFGLRFLHLGFARLQGRGSFLWAFVFLLVLLQMTTAVRPIVGTADTILPGLQEKKFFLGHWLDCLDEATLAARPPVARP